MLHFFPISDCVGNQSTVSQFRLFREKPRSARLFARRHLRRLSVAFLLFTIILGITNRSFQNVLHFFPISDCVGNQSTVLQFRLFRKKSETFFDIALVFLMSHFRPCFTIIKGITILHTIIYISIPNRSFIGMCCILAVCATLKEYPGNIVKSRKANVSQNARRMIKFVEDIGKS